MWRNSKRWLRYLAKSFHVNWCRERLICRNCRAKWTKSALKSAKRLQSTLRDRSSLKTLVCVSLHSAICQVSVGIFNRQQLKWFILYELHHINRYLFTFDHHSTLRSVHQMVFGKDRPGWVVQNVGWFRGQIGHGCVHLCLHLRWKWWGFTFPREDWGPNCRSTRTTWFWMGSMLSTKRIPKDVRRTAERNQKQHLTSLQSGWRIEKLLHDQKWVNSNNDWIVQ